MTIIPTIKGHDHEPEPATAESLEKLYELADEPPAFPEVPKANESEPITFYICSVAEPRGRFTSREHSTTHADLNRRHPYTGQAQKG